MATAMRRRAEYAAFTLYLATLTRPFLMRDVREAFGTDMETFFAACEVSDACA